MTLPVRCAVIRPSFTSIADMRMEFANKGLRLYKNIYIDWWVLPVCITLSSYLSSPTGLSCSQNEREYQKQRGLFRNFKKVIFEHVKNETRFVRNIGRGFKTPQEVPGQFLSLHVEMFASCVECASVFVYC